MKIELNRQFLDEISNFKFIYVLISGGYHSTTAALLLKDYGFDDEIGVENVILLHNKTYLETKHELDTIKTVIKTTNYRYIEIMPRLKQTPREIIRESFLQIDKIVERLRNNKRNYRDSITCCRKLKKGPAKYWYYRNIYRDRSIIIKSFLPYENKNRGILLSQLRKENTFIRFNKSQRVFCAYPFRDFFHKNSDVLFYEYLRDKEIMPEHTGCVLCPIRVAYMIKNNEYYDCPDLRFYLKMLSRINNKKIPDISSKFVVDSI